MGKLAIVIVNWNSGYQLVDCLFSLEATDKTNFVLEKVIIVDNASTDNSILMVESSGLKLPLEIIKNNQNLGFAKACNIGASAIEDDYVLFLNPDTVLNNDSLEVAMRFMDKIENQDIGILGIQLVDEDGKISYTCSRLPSFSCLINDALGLNKFCPKCLRGCHMTEWNHLNSNYVEQIMGAFFLVRTDIYRKLNGFDERYFVYYEEVDFSYRANQLGYKSYYLTDVQATHVGGGCSKQILAKRLFYVLRSKVLYIKKHFKIFEQVMLLGVVLFLEPIARISYSLVQLHLKDIDNTVKAYFMLWAWLIK